MSARDGYIGRAPGDSSVIIAKQTFEPTGVQTNFTFSSGYTVGYLDVYINGARQINASDYTASDGSTVGLTTYATSGDVLELVAYKAFNVTNPISNTAGGSLEGGTSLEVGTDLTVTGTSNVGVVTGGTYYGDGSNLTGILPSATAVPGIATGGHSVFTTINASGIVTAVRWKDAGIGYTVGDTPTITLSAPDTGAFGDYAIGETVTGSASSTTGVVNSWDKSTGILEVKIVDGTWTQGENIVGTNATRKVRIVNTDDLVTPYADNDNIETAADDILDFSQKNPFGDP